jgi:hypothetical protein
MRSLPRLLLALVLCLGVLTACGNDDDNGTNGSDVTIDDNGDNGNGDAGGAPAGWDTYTHDESGHRFALPEEPETDVQDLGIADLVLTMYLVERDDWALLVGFNAEPETGFDLDGAVEGAAGSVGGTIERRERSTVEGIEVLDAEIRFAAEGQEGLALFRVFVDAGTAVQLQTIGAEERRDEILDEHQSLVDGFEY